MRVHVAMIVRNEMDRHLHRAVECALEVVEDGGGEFIVTDDCSDDGSYEFLSDLGRVQRHEQPMFMDHEGRARQSHLDWIGEFAEPGDWVLSLDADETVNDPSLVRPACKTAAVRGSVAVLMPLYEFWSEDPPMYRTDGYWFGTLASRLFQFQSGAKIRDREFGCGSEPTYVADGVAKGKCYRQTRLHLLHWGYVREQDRVAKHQRYTQRMGGHGHNNRHIQSIIGTPTLSEYPT